MVYIYGSILYFNLYLLCNSIYFFIDILKLSFLGVDMYMCYEIKYDVKKINKMKNNCYG